MTPKNEHDPITTVIVTCRLPPGVKASHVAHAAEMAASQMAHDVKAYYSEPPADQKEDTDP